MRHSVASVHSSRARRVSHIQISETDKLGGAHEAIYPVGTCDLCRSYRKDDTRNGAAQEEKSTLVTGLIAGLYPRWRAPF